MEQQLKWERVTKDGSHIHDHQAKGTFQWRGHECQIRVDDSKDHVAGGHERWSARIWWGLTENGGWADDKQHVYFFKTLKQGKDFMSHLINEDLDECERILVERAMKMKWPAHDLEISDFVETFRGKEFDPDEYGLPEERPKAKKTTTKKTITKKTKEPESTGCAGVIALLLISTALVASCAF